jgi:hypothetical protein
MGMRAYCTSLPVLNALTNLSRAKSTQYVTYVIRHIFPENQPLEELVSQNSNQEFCLQPSMMPPASHPFYACPVMTHTPSPLQRNEFPPT